MVKLGDVCTVNPPKKLSQALYENKKVSFISMSDVTEEGKIFTNNKKSYSEVNKGFSYFLEDDVLFAKITPCMENGKGAIARGLINSLGVGSTEFHVLRPDKKFVTSEWIYRCVSFQKFRKLAEINMTGSAGQKRVPKKFLENVKIPLPPLETQKQIAKTLDTAAELLAMRKQQLTELDNLIKSTFYEMFGDPVMNEKGWEVFTLGNCLDRIESGWSPICEDRAVINKEWGICKLSAVTGGYYKEDENKAIVKDTKINLALEVKKGDLLFSRKNTIKLVGSCAYVFKRSKKLMIPDTVFRFCTKGNIHKLYLWGLFNHKNFKQSIQRLAGGTSGSMPNISKGRLKSLKIPLPPLTLQNKFASIVTKIEEQKDLVKKAIDETQYLFDSLMSQYFD